jgi:hypothetical protein
MDFQTPSPLCSALSELMTLSPRTSAMPCKISRNLVYVKSKKLFLLLALLYNYKCEYKKSYKCRKLLFHDIIEFIFEGKNYPRANGAERRSGR